jgi:predicted AAA+ superfamily ATPase
VLANRFKEAEFAADLFAVDSGHATEDYAAPENFFRITFLTEGLKRVLTSSLQRLAGAGGFSWMTFGHASRTASNQQVRVTGVP